MRAHSGRNNKFLFYLKGFLRDVIPDELVRLQLPKIIKQIASLEETQLLNRLQFYNQLGSGLRLPTTTPALNDLKRPKRGSAYYIDARETARYFQPDLKASFIFGDNTKIPTLPSFLKTRPILPNNQNAVLLKWNKVRHFAFVNDPFGFEKKSNRLIGMAEVKQANRIAFYQKYFHHPMMDLGQINRGNGHDEWIKPRISISDHLKYKFILCLEGFDVATNLKWVMSSNSLAVMPAPTSESWFMESTLIPDHHYVSIRPDFSDVEERMDYFVRHPEHARQIIRNANLHVEQFMNQHHEFLLEMAVMIKYFICTGQSDWLEPEIALRITDLFHIRD